VPPTAAQIKAALTKGSNTTIISRTSSSKRVIIPSG
jgi:hypothetical protein